MTERTGSYLKSQLESKFREFVHTCILVHRHLYICVDPLVYCIYCRSYRAHLWPFGILEHFVEVFKQA